MDNTGKNRRSIIFALGLVLVLVLVAGAFLISMCAARNRPGADDYPFSISVTFGDDPATQKNFSWMTSENSLQSVVEYYIDDGRDPDFSGGNVLRAEGFTKTFETSLPAAGKEYIADAALEPVTYIRHGVYLSELTPGTDYIYRVGDGRNYSEAGRFSTAPESAVSGDSGFSFLIFSDTQGYIQNDFALWGAVFKNAAGMYPDASFAAHLGDFTERQANALSWRQYFGLAEGLQDFTHVPVAGNREDDTFLTYFLLGTKGGVSALNGYYSFDYMNVHFTVLNTGDGNKDLSKAQLKWLRSDLTSDSARNAAFRIVMMHKAPYSDRNHADDPEIVSIRAQVLGIFEECGVDVVLEGHDHYYFRSEPVCSEGSEKADYRTETVLIDGEEVRMYYPDPEDGRHGVVYFMPGSSGVKQHDGEFREMPEIIAARSELMTSPTFCYCRVSGDSIVFTTLAFNRYSNRVSTVESWGIGTAG